MLTYLFMGCVLLVIGYAVHVLKWDMLIAGYNTMPKEKKKNVDTHKLSILLGLYGYISGAFFLLLAHLEYLGIAVPPTPAITLFVIWTMLILFNAQKYDGNTKRGKEYNERSKSDKQTRPNRRNK